MLTGDQTHYMMEAATYYSVLPPLPAKIKTKPQQQGLKK
jgi:hypothetical protein